ncbi:MAG: hypothetical protein WC686_04060 [Candidatus Shapirobacteria bacterium]
MSGEWRLSQICPQLGISEDQWPEWLMFSADRFSRWHRETKHLTSSCGSCIYRVDLAEEPICMWGVVDKRLVGPSKRRCEYYEKDEPPRLTRLEREAKYKRRQFDWYWKMFGGNMAEWDRMLPRIRRRGEKEDWVLVDDAMPWLRFNIEGQTWQQEAFGWTVPLRIRVSQLYWYNLKAIRPNSSVG